MDFKYHYTQEQEQFRREVSVWLDANLPEDIIRTGEPAGQDPALWERCEVFRRRLGERGWLAPTDPEEWGGGALTTVHALVLHEELESRGLLWLQEGGIPALRSALHQWGTDDQKKTYLPLISRGQANLWHTAMEPRAELDTSNIGVQAFRDGDDYVLNGENTFVGQGLWPHYLWTLALTDPEASPNQPTATFLVPGNLDGIRIQTSRDLVPGQTHQVNFDNVWVPAHCLLGDESDGWSAMQATLLADPMMEYPPTHDQDVTDLFQYAQETVRNGVTLNKEPFLQQLLVEAYINSQINCLFRARNAWMASSGRRLTYHIAQAALWEKRTSMRLSRIVRDVAGIYALLDNQDPRSPFQGRFELQQRRSLTKQNLTDGPDVQAVAMAKELGLGRSTANREDG